ncbi:MAG TPA: hypothetical protein VF548_11980 [Allosphingosinicella sp.]
MEIQVTAIALNSDTHLTYYQIIRDREKMFGAEFSQGEVRDVIAKLVKQEVLVETDIEWDILFGETLSHNQHGELDTNDFNFNFDELLNLGPAALNFTEENARDLREAAAVGQLPRALTILQKLSVDSAQWTGLPRGFRFTPEVKHTLVRLLREADRQLEQSGLPNSQAAQAKAYVHSAILLAEAPDPQPDLIWEMVQRGGALASIGQFFIAIIALFTATK